MTTHLAVQGMSCSGCADRVEQALESVSGVTAADVDLDNDSAVVTGEAESDELIAAVEDAGYRATA